MIAKCKLIALEKCLTFETKIDKLRLRGEASRDYMHWLVHTSITLLLTTKINKQHDTNFGWNNGAKTKIKRHQIYHNHGTSENVLIHFGLKSSILQCRVCIHHHPQTNNCWRYLLPKMSYYVISYNRIHVSVNFQENMKTRL